MDFSSAYLNGELDVPIFMRQPPGFELAGREHQVCELRKTLYGLKQSGRAWYQKLDSHLRSTGFARTYADNCVYVRGLGTVDVIIVAVYVDDLIIIGEVKSTVNAMKNELAAHSKMRKKLGIGAAPHQLSSGSVERRRSLSGAPT